MRVMVFGKATEDSKMDGPPTPEQLEAFAAMLLYNCVAVAVLANAGAVVRLVGVLMWPAVALHAGLAVWCLASLRRGPDPSLAE